jgi:hypothetical protein
MSDGQKLVPIETSFHQPLRDHLLPSFPVETGGQPLLSIAGHISRWGVCDGASNIDLFTLIFSRQASRYVTIPPSQQPTGVGETLLEPIP